MPRNARLTDQQWDHIQPLLPSYRSSRRAVGRSPLHCGGDRLPVPHPVSLCKTSRPALDPGRSVGTPPPLGCRRHLGPCTRPSCSPRGRRRADRLAGGVHHHPSPPARHQHPPPRGVPARSPRAGPRRPPRAHWPRDRPPPRRPDHEDPRHRGRSGPSARPPVWIICSLVRVCRWVTRSGCGLGRCCRTGLCGRVAGGGITGR